MEFLINRGIDMTFRDYRWNGTAQGTAAGSSPRRNSILRDAAALSNRGCLAHFLDLFSLESWLNMYAGKIDIGPPA